MTMNNVSRDILSCLSNLVYKVEWRNFANTSQIVSGLISIWKTMLQSTSKWCQMLQPSRLHYLFGKCLCKKKGGKCQPDNVNSDCHSTPMTHPRYQYQCVLIEWCCSLQLQVFFFSKLESIGTHTSSESKIDVFHSTRHLLYAYFPYGSSETSRFNRMNIYILSRDRRLQ